MSTLILYALAFAGLLWLLSWVAWFAFGLMTPSRRDTP